MKFCHEHNASRPLDVERPFGIRVRIRSNDTFARIIGEDWMHEHWYETKFERDQALQDMASRHLYSRNGDRPTLRYEAIER
ncbi:MAG: hypothetical protein PVF63_08905 [Gammaproteobacteria bacterium]|jgi:hypothetical protein